MPRLRHQRDVPFGKRCRLGYGNRIGMKQFDLIDSVGKRFLALAFPNINIDGSALLLLPVSTNHFVSSLLAERSEFKAPLSTDIFIRTLPSIGNTSSQGIAPSISCLPISPVHIPHVIYSALKPFMHCGHATIISAWVNNCDFSETRPHCGAFGYWSYNLNTWSVSGKRHTLSFP
ncbi:MAG TPA: hypothetical protein VK141_06465 [Nitrosomonas sp.]|nr:hypothetical protein [Nitrosomonas sp.]